MTTQSDLKKLAEQMASSTNSFDDIKTNQTYTFHHQQEMTPLLYISTLYPRYT